MKTIYVESTFIKVCYAWWSIKIEISFPLFVLIDSFSRQRQRRKNVLIKSLTERVSTKCYQLVTI